MRVARLTVERAENAVTSDPTKCFTLGSGSGVLALLIDRNNISMHYNLACGLIYLRELHDAKAMPEPYFGRVSLTHLQHLSVDPDMDPIRCDARFQQAINLTLTRLGLPRTSLPGEARGAAPAAPASAGGS